MNYQSDEKLGIPLLIPVIMGAAAIFKQGYSMYASSKESAAAKKYSAALKSEQARTDYLIPIAQRELETAQREASATAAAAAQRQREIIGIAVAASVVAASAFIAFK